MLPREIETGRVTGYARKIAASVYAALNFSSEKFRQSPVGLLDHSVTLIV